MLTDENPASHMILQRMLPHKSWSPTAFIIATNTRFTSQNAFIKLNVWDMSWCTLTDNIPAVIWLIIHPCNFLVTRKHHLSLTIPSKLNWPYQTDETQFSSNTYWVENIPKFCSKVKSINWESYFPAVYPNYLFRLLETPVVCFYPDKFTFSLSFSVLPTLQEKEMDGKRGKTIYLWLCNKSFNPL